MGLALETHLNMNIGGAAYSVLGEVLGCLGQGAALTANRKDCVNMPTAATAAKHVEDRTLPNDFRRVVHSKLLRGIHALEGVGRKILAHELLGQELRDIWHNLPGVWTRIWHRLLRVWTQIRHNLLKVWAQIWHC